MLCQQPRWHAELFGVAASAHKAGVRRSLHQLMQYLRS
ncbi:hypothetical protein LI90_2124 [Carbonactinospora thermoautotrophica]|uniref:Uncharacterized protein n=1 Tax=Carbonactinospora thermoautotrophica TaxID=1469144 RepID=A0A132MTM7_9ACTN|nr:hypothetical protein LI90_2124 [Carbonactinospora thermoautotrophica]